MIRLSGIGLLVFLLPALVVMVASCTGPNTTTTPTLTPISTLTTTLTPTSIPTSTLTSTPIPHGVSETIKSDVGGEISLADGAKIAIPAGAFVEDTKVAVAIAAEPPLPRDTNLNRGSSVYEISVADIESFSSPLTITIPYDEREIPEGVPEEDLQAAYYDELAQEWILAGGEVDTEKNLISLSITHLSLWTWVAEEFGHLEYPGGNFTVNYVITGPNAVPNKAYVETLSSELESIRERISDLGFKTPTHNITVKVRDYPGFCGKAIQSKLGENFSFMEVDNDLDINDLQVTSAHEYFHLCQDRYEFNLWWFRSPYLWFYEASGLWIEDLLYPDVNTYMDNLNVNRDFILEPLNTNTGEHGYGAASFVKFLAWKYGNSIVSEIMNELAEQAVGSRDAIPAISAVIRSHGDWLDDVFGEFSRRYWATRDYDEAGSWLEPNMDTLYISSDNPVVEFEFELGPLSAKACRIILRPGSTGSTAGILLLILEGTDNPMHEVYTYCGRRLGAHLDWSTIWTFGEWDEEFYGHRLTSFTPNRAYELMRSPLVQEDDRDMAILVAANNDSLPGSFKGKVKIFIPVHTLPDINTLGLLPEELPDLQVEIPDVSYATEQTEGTGMYTFSWWASVFQDLADEGKIALRNPETGSELMADWEFTIIMNISQSGCAEFASDSMSRLITYRTEEGYQLTEVDDFGDEGFLGVKPSNSYLLCFRKGPYICSFLGHFTSKDYSNYQPDYNEEVHGYLIGGMQAAARVMESKIDFALAQQEEKLGFVENVPLSLY
jgi:hypothetical protein